MTREITHMKAFMLALDSMGKDPPEIGKIPLTPELVVQYFNDSTGARDFGDKDERGAWNQDHGWQFVEAPAFQDLQSAAEGTRTAASSTEEGDFSSRRQSKVVS